MKSKTFSKLEPQEQRDLIAGVVQATVSNFLYYDRKEDEDLGTDDLEEAIHEGVLSVEDIVEFFKAELEHNLS